MKKCEICNSENRVFKSKVNGMMLCYRHSLQLRRNGFIAKAERYGKNEYKEFEDYYEIYIKNYKTGELLGKIIVDKDDFEKVIEHKWDLHKGYARNREVGLMHRFILNDVELIDHINQNKLDNRKENLREANRKLNAYNNFKPQKHNKTGYRGVSKVRGKYRANIRINGKQIQLGIFNTPEEASSVYLEKLKEVLPDV